MKKMNRMLAAHLSSICNYTYESELLIQAAFPEYEIKLVENKDTDTQAYILRGKHVYIVSFRGTEITGGWSWTDIATNLKVRPIQHPEIPNCRVHHGYWKAYESIHDPISKFVDEAINENKTVVCTGHSLGGVLATQSCAVLKYTSCFTFGAPRSGDKNFEKHIETMGTPIFRIVRNLDIARSYAPYLFGYRRGSIWTLKENAQLIEGATKSILNGVPFPVKIGVHRHAVGGYSSLLRGLEL